MYNLLRHTLLFFFLLGSLANSLAQSIGDQKQIFEAEMVKALKLQLLKRDSDYSYSSELRIFGDTVVGFWARVKDGQIHKKFFIQSLKNPAFKIEFDNAELTFPYFGMIDYYRNRCLYFGRYPQTDMQTLCSDGTLTNYFNNKKDADQRKRKDINQVLVYKDQAVLSDFTGVYVYNIPTQKLFWKYNSKANDGTLFRSIFGNKLIMSLDSDGFVDIICYDLDKHQVVWTNKIIGNNSDISPFSDFGPSSPPPYPLYNDNNNVIIPGSVACYLIDINSGVITNTVPWEIFSKNKKISNFKIESSKLYITNLNDDLAGLSCLDIKTCKITWNVKGASLYGLYRNYIIGYSPIGTGKYLIIDKSTGIIKDKIDNPDRFPDFYFIDNYILINHNAIYE